MVSISALKGEGIKEASSKAARLARMNDAASPVHEFAPEVEAALDEIETMLTEVPEEQKRFYAIKLFERDDKIEEQLKHVPEVEDIIAAVEKEYDDDAESIITNERYNYITSVIRDSLVKSRKEKLTTSDKIDRIVTNRWLALPIFAAVMWIVYYVSVSTVGAWATDWANDGLFGDGFRLFGMDVPGIPVIIGNALDAVNCAGWLQSLILDGIVAGVGAVLGFVPQMLVLFIFLAFLEACGYMARVAFNMDRFLRQFGLSGQSIIPQLMGAGWGVALLTGRGGWLWLARRAERETGQMLTVLW